MENKVQPGKWYHLGKGQPHQDTEHVTSCMKVPGGVLVRNVTFIGGNKFGNFAPGQSSESMAFVPHANIDLKEGYCSFTNVP